MAHSPAMSFWTAKSRFCSQLLFLVERLDNSKMCYNIFSLSVPVEDGICEKPAASEAKSSRHFHNRAVKMNTAVCMYIAGLCAKLSGCVEGHPWDLQRWSPWELQIRRSQFWNVLDPYITSHYPEPTNNSLRSGGRLNKKDGLTRYGNSHVKDKTP